MIASLRRTRTDRSRSAAGRTRAGVAVVAALSLGLAACGDGDGDGDAADDGEEEIEAPADDGAVDETPDEGAAGDDVEQPEAAGFETLTGSEVVPGISLDAPVDEGSFQAQPTPTGSAYVGSLDEQNGAVTVNVEFDGQSLDELLAGVDTLVEAGQAEVSSEPETIEVEGAEEASRVELSAPGGEATATGIFATVEGNAISIAVEVLEGSDIDVDAIIDSIVIDPDRLQAEGTLDLEDAPTSGGPADPSDEATTEDTEGDAADDTEG